jgi:hypothetical protein
MVESVDVICAVQLDEVAIAKRGANHVASADHGTGLPMFALTCDDAQ